MKRSNCKSMETISCYSNQNSYQTETNKKNYIGSEPTCRCYLCNMERIDLMASEMSFENVNGQWTDGWMDGWTPDVSLYYKLTLFEETF